MRIVKVLPQRRVCDSARALNLVGVLVVLNSNSDRILWLAKLDSVVTSAP